jgi:hypothetical protein
MINDREIIASHLACAARMPAGLACVSDKIEQFLVGFG